MVEEAIRSVQNDFARSSFKPPIVIRLSGHAHINDKLALNEIGRQIYLQTGSRQLITTDEEDDSSSNLDVNDEPALGSRLTSILVRVSPFPN